MKIIYLTFFIVFSFCNTLHAFNIDKCNENVYRKNIKKAGGWEGAVMMTIVASSTSSAQLTSSWGDCSLFSSVNFNQKLFISQAFEPLQIDLARGNGEFADAFAEISKCNSMGKFELKKELQQNYRKIYDENVDEVDKTHSRILNVMRNDQIISKNCKLDI